MQPSRTLAFLLAGGLALAACSGTHPARPGAAAQPVAIPQAHTGTVVHCRYGAAGFAPDPVCTPGERDPRVTAKNLQATICSPGWSRRARPQAAVTDPVKRERMKAYSTRTIAAQTELDHLIPIGIGGATSVANLWPEPRHGRNGAARKDRLEYQLHLDVCAGRVSLGQAQSDIATAWQTAYLKYCPCASYQGGTGRED